MARTTEEIKKTMTDTFLGNAVLRSMYGLSEGTAWNECFSSVSLENILIFVVAASMRVLETIFDQFKSDVDEKVDGAVVASIPWYHKMALEYQKGDSLVVSQNTYAFGYANVDESKRIIKYVAVRDKGTSVQVLVSGESNGVPTKLSDTDLEPFKAYMNKIKLVGVVLGVNSFDSDSVKINASIQVDPLVIGTNGVKISDGSRPVEDAIKAHLKNILYGGTLNKTKLVDAIQAVEGVEDVTLNSVQYYSSDDGSWTTMPSNNYVGKSGSYVANNLTSTLEYVV